MAGKFADANFLLNLSPYGSIKCSADVDILIKKKPKSHLSRVIREEDLPTLQVLLLLNFMLL